MSLQREMEAQVLSEVSEFVASLNSGSGVVADMTGLTEVTSRLPLSSLEYWERLSRTVLPPLSSRGPELQLLQTANYRCGLGPAVGWISEQTWRPTFGATTADRPVAVFRGDIPQRPVRSGRGFAGQLGEFASQVTGCR